MISRNRSLCLADGVLAVLFLALVVLFLETCFEDAFINYRCARNFVRGTGLVYSPGEWAESTSSIAWTFLLAGFYRLGVDLCWAGRFLTVAFSAAFFLVLRRLSRTLLGRQSWLARLPLLGIVCATCVSAGFGNLLEGAGVAFVATLLVLGMVESRWKLMTFAACLFMVMRPEGALFAVFAGAWLIGRAHAKAIPARDVWRYMALTECFLLALVLFRFWYFGDVIPETVRSKALPPLNSEHPWKFHQFEYLWRYFAYTGPVLLLLAVLALVVKTTRPYAIALLGFVGINCFVAGARGDWMLHYRLLTPYLHFLFLGAALLLAALDKGPRTLRAIACVAVAYSVAHVCLPDVIRESCRQFFPAKCVPRRVSQPTTHVMETRMGPVMTNLDFAAPDDLSIVDYGGRDGYFLDGVAAIEIQGLSDREMTRQWPGFRDAMLGGTFNWRYVMDRNPTFFFFSDTIRWSTKTMLESPEIAVFLERYVLCRAQYVSTGEFLVRRDRPIAPLLIANFGDFCPATDCQMATVEELYQDAGDKTPWHHLPWRSESETFPNEWNDWGETRRVCAKLNVSEGKTIFRKPLPNAAPTILLFGLENDAPLDAIVHIYAKRGESLSPVSVVAFAPDDRKRFITMGVGIPASELEGMDEIVLDVDAAAPGLMYVSAFRWAGDVPPALPAAYIEEKWNGLLRYHTARQDAAGAALAREGLQRFEASPAARVEDALRKQREFNRAIVPYRDAVRKAPDSLRACDALDAHCLQAGDPEARCAEWRALAAQHPQLPETWLRLTRACLDTGDLPGAFDAADMSLKTTIGDTPPRTRLAFALHTFADSYTPGEISVYRQAAFRNSLDRLAADALRSHGETAAAVARILALLGDTRKALDMAEKISVKYGDVRSCMCLLDTLAQSGTRESEIRGLFRRMVQQRPNAFWTWNSLACSLERAECYEEAFDCIEKALALAPDSEEIRQNATRLERLRNGVMPETGGDNSARRLRTLKKFLSRIQFKALARDVRAGLRRDNHGGSVSAGDMENEAARLLHDGDRAAALNVYRLMVETYPNHYPGFESLSNWFVEKNDLDGARELWLDYVERHPENHLGWFSLGLAHERLQEYAKARDAYRRGLQLEPEAKGTQEALARVLNL